VVAWIENRKHELDLKKYFAAFAIGVIGSVVAGVATSGGSSKNAGTPATTAPPVTGSPGPEVAPAATAVSQAFHGHYYLAEKPPLWGTNPDHSGQMTIDGVTYQYGLQYQFTNASCPHASTTWAIPPGAKRFTAAIDNDSVQTNPFWENSHMY
jgi:hypothetical protein